MRRLKVGQATYEHDGKKNRIRKYIFKGYVGRDKQPKWVQDESFVPEQGCKNLNRNMLKE